MGEFNVKNGCIFSLPLPLCRWGLMHSVQTNGDPGLNLAHEEACMPSTLTCMGVQCRLERGVWKNLPCSLLRWPINCFCCYASCHSSPTERKRNTCWVPNEYKLNCQSRWIKSLGTVWQSCRLPEALSSVLPLPDQHAKENWWEDLGGVFLGLLNTDVLIFVFYNHPVLLL